MHIDITQDIDKYNSLQIAYAATATDLANFAFFARTCNSNADTGPALSQFMGNVDEFHDVTMIYTLKNTFTESLAESFHNSWPALGPNYRILKTITFDPDVNRTEYPEYITDMLVEVEEAGTPGLVLFLNQIEAVELYEAMKNMNQPWKYMPFHPEPKGTASSEVPLPLGLSVLSFCA